MFGGHKEGQEGHSLVGHKEKRAMAAEQGRGL